MRVFGGGVVSGWWVSCSWRVRGLGCALVCGFRGVVRVPRVCGCLRCRERHSRAYAACPACVWLFGCRKAGGACRLVLSPLFLLLCGADGGG